MDCLELVYNLYSVYLSKPVIEEESTSNMLTVKSKDSFVDWELNPLDLFGEVGSNLLIYYHRSDLSLKIG